MKKKLFFLGTPQIAVPSLEVIARLKNYDIIGVGVFPDKIAGRKKILTPSPVKVAGQKLSLQIYEIANARDLQNLAKKLDFDLGIVIAFGMIVTTKTLNLKPFINVHFSLLPKFRGASPVQSAILNGQKTSGITWQQMKTKLDSGDILLQKKYNIENASCPQVWEKFAKKTAKNFPFFLDSYFSQKLEPQKQNKLNATFCTKFSRSDGQVNPKTETAEAIYRKFLAFASFPGIFISTKYGRLKILSASLTPGKPSDLALECYKKTVLYTNLAQLEGKKIMPIRDILNGYPDILTF